MARGLVALSFLLSAKPPLVLGTGEHAVPVGGGLLLVVELGHEHFAVAGDQRAAALAGVGSRQGQAIDVGQQVVGNHLLEACLTLAQLASAVSGDYTGDSGETRSNASAVVLALGKCSGA